MNSAELAKRLRQLRRKELSSAHFRSRGTDLDIGCEIICSYYCCTRLNGSSASHPTSAGRRPGWTGDLNSSSLQQRIISAENWAVRTGRFFGLCSALFQTNSAYTSLLPSSG